MNCKKGTQRISHKWGKENDSNYDGNCTSMSPPVRDLEKNQRSLYVRLSVCVVLVVIVEVTVEVCCRCVDISLCSVVKQRLKCNTGKVFANKINRVQACIDARGHHFQHLL
jgi:hypothetical protein